MKTILLLTCVVCCGLMFPSLSFSCSYDLDCGIGYSCYKEKDKILSDGICIKKEDNDAVLKERQKPFEIKEYDYDDDSSSFSKGVEAGFESNPFSGAVETYSKRTMENYKYNRRMKQCLEICAGNEHLVDNCHDFCVEWIQSHPL